MQRTRYLNAVNTFKELLSMGVVPIVNENDTVSVSVSGPVWFSLRSGPGLTLLSRKSNSETTIHYLP